MKTKHMELPAKIFLTVVVMVLAGLLIAWMAGVFKDKKQNLDSSTEKTNDVINAMADFDLLVYDGATISGESVKDLITSLKDKEVPIAVKVCTLDNTTGIDYNYTLTSTGSTSNLGTAVTTTPPPSKSTSGYINPTGNFKGDIIKNSNEDIVCLKFTQKK